MQLSLVAAFLCRDDHGCVLLSKGWALSRLSVPLVELHATWGWHAKSWGNELYGWNKTKVVVGWLRGEGSTSRCVYA